MLFALVTIALRLPLARMVAMRLSDRDVSRDLLDRALSREATDRLARRTAAEARARSEAPRDEKHDEKGAHLPHSTARQAIRPAPEHP